MRKIVNTIFGVVALSLAAYFAFSDALVVDLSTALTSRRSQIFVVGLFLAGGMVLIAEAWQRSSILKVGIAYVVILVGSFIVWLIFYGSDV